MDWGRYKSPNGFKFDLNLVGSKQRTQLGRMNLSALHVADYKSDYNSDCNKHFPTFKDPFSPVCRELRLSSGTNRVSECF